MKLIDADVAIKGVQDRCLGATSVIVVENRIIDMLNRMPAVDAVEVVRCKDCKWGREACGNIECHVDLNIPSEYHGYYWFCPNGERKE